MAHDVEVKNAVRGAYVFDRLSLEMAAEKAGVSFGTARRWKANAESNGDNWDKARDVHVMASGGIENIAQGLLTGFLIKYRKLMSELEENTEMATAAKVEALSALADSFAKMTASSKKLLPETSAMATAMRAIEMMANIVKSKKPHLLPDFLEMLDDLEVQFKKEFK
ncbi:DNA-binding protein [[Haemophilus] ducreyi]|uniref:Conserved possible DNA-binding protein n=2 Tax=Haemophilus ducreyi TaxID=730 RepID=Q7VNK2_HAEDU|nr:DUF1804 family protein [[Haemophilus] ducreyi]AAP95457.1 conserved possible DNA-binding protein [[Haemophilus] ducreyi 35000HP]AKO30559.1 DNA-binding protein [[Haemophilus] ducreyi]AKO31996.1 DNA-binding protein [[Haemophilus] ducreyi]AKO33451.1 DNA-binding protein [[Haemophilus] ducreyi]AKO34898.1 DNA-binding protein [[Haemophilus] ducreyi]